jgi:WD40 repeat protein
MTPFGDNPFEIAWSPDGSALMVSGELTLGSIARNSWNLSYLKEFDHKKAITCITWINENVFATAGLDKAIKIWDFSKKKLLNTISSKNQVL